MVLYLATFMTVKYRMVELIELDIDDNEDDEGPNAFDHSSVLSLWDRLIREA
jgi:hypothetical protein